LPRGLRRGSGLGQSRHPDRCSQLADPDRQSLQGHAGVVAPAAQGPGARAVASGFAGH
jgi:hypothetical protein